MITGTYKCIICIQVAYLKLKVHGQCFWAKKYDCGNTLAKMTDTVDIYNDL